MFFLQDLIFIASYLWRISKIDEYNKLGQYNTVLYLF